MSDPTPPYGPPPFGPPPYPPGEQGPERRSRKPVVIAMVAALALLAVAIVVPVLVHRLRAAGEAAVARNLKAVRTYRGLTNQHTEGDVDYPQTPPVGGPHDPVWLDCGVYDAPVRDENAVHDLEHGSVWITYRPGLDNGDVEKLAGLLPHNGILSPYDGLPAPVVVTVWGAQLRLTGADDPRLPLFLTRYGDAHTAPEPFASCAGGVRETEDSGTQV